VKKIEEVSSFSGGELLLGLLKRCWGTGTEITGFSGASGGSGEVLTMGCNENKLLPKSKKDEITSLRVDMGNPGQDSNCPAFPIVISPSA